MRIHSLFLYLTCVLGVSACMHPRAIVLSPSTPQGVRVHGVGEASAAPNIARTQLGVDIRASTPEQASAQASQRMAAMIAALKQLGIADSDLRTSRYAVTFEPEAPDPEPQPQTPVQPKAKSQSQPQSQPQASANAAQPTQPSAAESSPAPRGQYRVVNTLAVTIRDLNLVGRVLQVAAEADANNVWGITFDLEDDGALVEQARSAAVADAQHSAQELAKLAGVELGEVVSIIEDELQDSYGDVPTYALQSAAVSVPVERGEITIHYDVQLVYATRRK